MERGSFMDIISVHYKDIKKLFASRIAKHGFKFSEDAFNDAFIKCAQHFGNDIITYDDAIKYFYVAFSNTTKGESHKSERFVKYEDSSEDIEDDPEYYANYVYNIIMDAVTEKFGENNMMIYSLYKYHGWSKNELERDGYDCADFDNKIRKIHKFAKSYRNNDLLKQ